MKRYEFLRHLRFCGCVLKREGARHSLYQNPVNGVVEAVPRHVEIDNNLVEKICKSLEISRPGKR
jgi:mRNA interferase HicA